MTQPGNPIIRESSRLRKFQGCALGCLAIVLIVVAFSVALYYWAVTPGPQVDTEVVLGSDSLGLLHIERLKEDPGLKAMVGALLVEMQELRDRKLQREQLPWALKALISWQGSIDPDDVEDSLKNIPRDVTVSLEPVPGDPEPQLVAAVNLSRFPRVLRLFLGLAGWGGNGVSINGNPALRFSKGGNVLAFVDSTLMWGQSLEVLEKVLQPTPENPRTGIGEILATYRARDLDWDIYGVILNKEGAISWLLQRSLGNETSGSNIRQMLDSHLSEIERISLGIDVVDDNSIKGEVSILCSDEQAAQRHLDAADSTTLLPGSLRESEGLALQETVSRRGREIFLEVRASQVRAALLRKLEEAWKVRR